MSRNAGAEGGDMMEVDILCSGGARMLCTWATKLGIAYDKAMSITSLHEI